jgi:hypothetical protein
MDATHTSPRMTAKGLWHSKCSLSNERWIMTQEQKLWRSVLEQAYKDAGAFGQRERDLARAWLRADNKENLVDLTLVCDFADIPVDRVINWARRTYNGK